MKYQSGGAFRRALEDRLRIQSVQSGIPLVRMRKMIAFDRFLARLLYDQSGQWIIKGGFALQLRLGQRARTTKDIDLLTLGQREAVYPELRKAGSLDLGDWFSFEVANAAHSTIEGFGGVRYQLDSRLDGRIFERFHLDVGIGDPLIDPAEYLQTPGLLAFAGLSSTAVPCYPITQQIAEKLHAYTRTFQSGESSRVKDYVDILLLAGMGEIDGERLNAAIAATFHARHTHPLPAQLPTPPQNWNRPFQQMAHEVALGYASLAEADGAMQRFLNPILRGETIAVWYPIDWCWRR
jgi:hypothetical protein